MQIYTYGKSRTHLQIQQALQKMLAPEEILIEQRFPEIGRVADVVWPAQKLIFEVQVSPISSHEIRARNRDYTQIGYKVVWILHDNRFNRSRMTPAEVQLRFSPHYFTNINAFGKGFFYDQHSFIRFKRRIKRSRRFPVRFKQVIPLNTKQLPRQCPLERRRWVLSFEGDAFQREDAWQLPDQPPFSLWKWFLRPYRLVLHLLLEKTTY